MYGESRRMNHERMFHVKQIWRLIVLGLLIPCAICAASPQKKSKSRPGVAVDVPLRVKQQNQFVTVEEFVNARLPKLTPVSVEGYAVLGYKTTDGGVRMNIVDSVDHVLNTKDADTQAGA